MSEVVTVRVLLAGGTVVERPLSLTSGEQHELSLKESESRVHAAGGPDLFEALRALRRTLEAEDMRLLCAGARIDVYPSGMSRSMSAGRKAYVLRLGSPARTDDLVDIFAHAASEEVGTVEQQEQYYKNWVASLRSKAEGLPELPGWSFDVQEVSAGVYEVTGTDALGHRVQTKGTDCDALINECREAAAKMAARLSSR
jgi:hypothetical protein